MKTHGYIPIWDSGHGYLIEGQYQTAGKRSPDLGRGILFEGVSNKHFIWDIMKECVSRGVPFYATNPELTDVSLATRVSRADKIFRDNPRTYLFSMHSNAGGGTGIEGFTSKGNTVADSIAEVFLADLEKAFPKLKPRFDYSDGDRDKEAGYYILKRSKCPSFLLEMLFMDHPDDYELLWDDNFRSHVVTVIVDTAERLYKGL